MSQAKKLLKTVIKKVKILRSAPQANFFFNMLKNIIKERNITKWYKKCNADKKFIKQIFKTVIKGMQNITEKK